MGERQPTDVGVDVTSTQALDHVLDTTPADVGSLPNPVQMPGLDSQALEDTAIGDTSLTVSPGTLANPPDSTIEPLRIVDYGPQHVPYSPSDPVANARRADILADQESGPLSKFSEILSGIRGSKRFDGYLKDYAAVLGIGGTSSQDIRRFKIRAEKAYRREPSPTLRARVEDNMKRNLELLIEHRFDTDLVTIAALKRDAGKTQESIKEEGAELAGEFKPVRRGDKIKKLRTLRARREGLLISNYEIYLNIWKDLNPDGVNLETMRAAFEMAGTGRAKLALAEKLYADVSNTINQRSLAYAAQWKQLTIDQGRPSDMADEETHLLLRDATEGSLVSRVYGMQQIRALTEELLLKTFGISSRLWAEMTTGSQETQFDLDAAFEFPSLGVDNKIKLAKGMYRKIDKRLKAESTRLFNRLAAILREKGGLGELDVTLRINKRQAQLKSLPRTEQYKKIKVWSRAVGLAPEPVPAAKTS